MKERGAGLRVVYSLFIVCPLFVYGFRPFFDRRPKFVLTLSQLCPKFVSTLPQAYSCVFFKQKMAAYLIHRPCYGPVMITMRQPDLVKGCEIGEHLVLIRGLQ